MRRALPENETPVQAIRIFVASLLCAFSCIGSSVSAQTVSPWLPPDHWASRAAVQLHALGLAPPGFDPVPRAHPSGEIAAVFAYAWLTATARAATASDRDDVAGTDPAAILRLVDGYVRRFANDRPGVFRQTFIDRDRTRYLHAELTAGLAAREGALLAGGFDANRNWVQPQPPPDYTTVGGAADIGAALHNRVAFTLEGDLAGNTGRIERLTVDARIGDFALWAGRRAPGYAPLRSGGLVQYGDVAFEGGGVRVVDALSVPLIGALTAETFVGKLDANGFVDVPLLWGTRVHVQPHARFDLGITRTAVFGAMDESTITLQQIGEVIIGANLSGEYADDQVASIDARWRLPLRLVPLELYGEWGSHDVDIGVLWDVPAFGIGARIAALPFAPGIGVALEHTQINRSCCENPPWYHHFELADGWTESGVLLGHPLGGHGREWRVVANAALLDARVLLDVQAFRRTRGDENLFADARTGRAHGAALQLDVRAADRIGFVVRGAFESATSWSAHAVSAGVTLRY